MRGLRVGGARGGCPRGDEVCEAASSGVLEQLCRRNSRAHKLVLSERYEQLQRGDGSASQHAEEILRDNSNRVIDKAFWCSTSSMTCTCSVPTLSVGKPSTVANKVAMRRLRGVSSVCDVDAGATSSEESIGGAGNALSFTCDGEQRITLTLATNANSQNFLALPCHCGLAASAERRR